MSRTADEISFAARHEFDRPIWRAAAVLIPVAAGAVGTFIYASQTQAIWGFLFVLWFVVLDLCLIGATLFRQAKPPVASRAAYCAIALAGGAVGALQHYHWGGAIPILTMLVAVLAALILEQLLTMARSAIRVISRPGALRAR